MKISNSTQNLSFYRNQKPLEYKTFKQLYSQEYKNTPLEKTVYNIKKHKDLLIGKGSSKKVFSIPKLQNFVLAVIPKETAKIKNKLKLLPPFKNFNRFNFEYNFGQPIATDNNGDYILMKTKGKSHSLANWNSRLEEIALGTKDVTAQESKLFLSELKIISEFPQKSFDDFAEKLEYLNTKNIKIDMINANNLLIDRKNKSFNPIDIDYNSKNYRKLSRPLNTTNDMINLLLDATLHKYLLEILNENKKQELTAYSNKIIQKCRIAGEKYNLETSTKNVEYIYKFMDKLVKWKSKQDLKMFKSYNEFRKLYNI